MSERTKLSRDRLRKLKVGATAHESGIAFTRLAGGDGRWSVNVMVARVRHHVVVGLESEGYTKTQAEELVARLKAGGREREHGVASPKARGRLTIAREVDDYLEFLREHNGRDVDAKARRFRQHIVPGLGKISLATLTADDWSRYVAARVREGAAPATINRERSALLHLLNTAVRRKRVRSMPCELARQKEPPGKLVYLTPDQAQRLVAAAEADQSRHALPFVMVALYTGMRQSPVLNLRVGDIDVERRVLWVGRDKAGRREQPMPRMLAEYLQALVKGRSALPEDLLFASPRAKGGRLYQVNSIFARCVQRAGLGAGVTPHTMRHTAATNAAHAGLDAATIQAIGGWKTRAMADRYTHAASLSTAMDALETRLQSRAITHELQRAGDELP